MKKIYSIPNCCNKLRSILIGAGFVRGDWEKEDKTNKKMLYIIEPVVESLLQVGDES